MGNFKFVFNENNRSLSLEENDWSGVAVPWISGKPVEPEFSLNQLDMYDITDSQIYEVVYEQLNSRFLDAALPQPFQSVFQSYHAFLYEAAALIEDMTSRHRQKDEYDRPDICPTGIGRMAHGLGRCFQLRQAVHDYDYTLDCIHEMNDCVPEFYQKWFEYSTYWEPHYLETRHMVEFFTMSMTAKMLAPVTMTLYRNASKTMDCPSCQLARPLMSELLQRPMTPPRSRNKMKKILHRYTMTRIFKLYNDKAEQNDHLQPFEKFNESPLLELLNCCLHRLFAFRLPFIDLFTLSPDQWLDKIFGDLDEIIRDRIELHAMQAETKADNE